MMTILSVAPGLQEMGPQSHTDDLAHDLNNALSIISGNLEILADAELPAGLDAAVKRAENAVVTATVLTERLSLNAV